MTCESCGKMEIESPVGFVTFAKEFCYGGCTPKPTVTCDMARSEELVFRDCCNSCHDGDSTFQRYLPDGRQADVCCVVLSALVGEVGHLSPTWESSR
jgi:hypothetical protein